MKAARIHQHGGPDVLVYEDVPEPKIKANQILVRVRACALNHLDLFVRAGIPGMKFPMPHILGSDIAGEVVEVGELCERIKPGTRVLLSPGTSCRQCEQCLLGQDNLCRRYTMFGYAIDGGNTELLAAPEYSAIPIEKYAITRAGSARLRCSVRPVSAITSSTSSGGNARVSTPTETKSDKRRSETGFFHPARGTPANYTNVSLTERYCG